MSLWLSARNPHNTESYHTEHPQTTSNGDPTETCRDADPTETCQDAAPHRNLQGCRIPEKPARTPHPTETCEDAAPHRNLRGCWFIDQGRMRHFYPVVHFAFEGQAIKLTLLT